MPGRLSPGNELPSLQHTSLGWVLAGSTPPNSLSSKASQSTKRTHCAVTAHMTNEQLDTQLKKFWEIEDISCPSSQCQIDPIEQHCTENTVRDTSGRYIVTLPKKPNHVSLGSSKSLALKRFFSLEKRLSKDPELRQDYNQFMSEYKSLGHMQPAEPTSSTSIYHFHTIQCSSCLALQPNLELCLMHLHPQFQDFL